MTVRRRRAMPRRGVLARVSLAGAARCVAAPLSQALQLALVGARASSDAQAAFGVAHAVARLSAGALNFLADGVAAEVGARAGANDRERARACAALALALALVSGTASAIACAATLTPSARGAFRLTPEVAALANEMFPWVLGATPFAMAFESAMGTVCGIGRVETATRWSAGKAAADAAATLAALGLGRGDAAKMRWIGVGTFAVSVAQAGLGWWLVSTTTPRGWDEPLAPRATSARRLGAAETFGFLANGASMVARSILLQSSFFVAVVVAARNLEPSGLAAHHIVVSLWMVCSYVVDGFATCATVIGSRLFGAGRKDELVRLSHTLVAWGVVTGFVFSAALVAGESAIPSVFTRDAKTKEALLGSGVWRVLVLAQPINAAVFVYDGFIYATHSFSFVREVMATGVGLVFLPTLYLANRPLVSLKGIWTAKLALNAWRVAWLAGRVHVWLPRQEMSPRDDNGENESESDSDDDEEAAHYEPLLPGNESEEDVESVTPQTNDVQYESSLKPSKIKAKGLSPIRTPELAMARASSLRASAGEFAPSSSVL